VDLVRLTGGRVPFWAAAGAAAVLFVVATLVYVLAPAGAGSVDDAVPDGVTVLARATADGTEVFVLGRGDRMQLAMAYDDIKGWRVTTTSPVAQTEPVVWAALSRRGSSASAVYGRLDGAPPTVTWADGRTTPALVSGAVWLAARAGRHDCRGVAPVGPAQLTFDC
jgi:hypothetical protein